MDTKKIPGHIYLRSGRQKGYRKEGTTTKRNKSCISSQFLILTWWLICSRGRTFHTTGTVVKRVKLLISGGQIFRKSGPTLKDWNLEIHMCAGEINRKFLLPSFKRRSQGLGRRRSLLSQRYFMSLVAPTRSFLTWTLNQHQKQ